MNPRREESGKWEVGFKTDCNRGFKYIGRGSVVVSAWIRMFPVFVESSGFCGAVLVVPFKVEGHSVSVQFKGHNDKITQKNFRNQTTTAQQLVYQSVNSNSDNGPSPTTKRLAKPNNRSNNHLHPDPVGGQQLLRKQLLRSLMPSKRNPQQKRIREDRQRQLATLGGG